MSNRSRKEAMETLELDVAARIVDTLNLQDVAPEDIDPAAPLFGSGLGLDSIDALELVVMLQKHWGIKITDVEVGKAAFSSINSLAEFVRKNRQK